EDRRQCDQPDGRAQAQPDERGRERACRQAQGRQAAEKARRGPARNAAADQRQEGQGRTEEGRAEEGREAHACPCPFAQSGLKLSPGRAAPPVATASFIAATT